MENNQHPSWIYRGERFLPYGHSLELSFGFTYEIRNLINSRVYCGRKAFWIGGATHRPTNFMDYWGSSRHLRRDIDLQGHSSFSREILELYPGPRSLAAAETALIHRKVRDLGLDMVYNKAVIQGGRTVLLTRLYRRDGTPIKGKRSRSRSKGSPNSQ